MKFLLSNFNSIFRNKKGKPGWKQISAISIKTLKLFLNDKWIQKETRKCIASIIIPIINKSQALQHLHWPCGGSEQRTVNAEAARGSHVWLNSGVFITTTAAASLHWVSQMFMIVLTEWKRHLDKLDGTFHWKNPRPTSGCEVVAQDTSVLLEIGKNRVEVQQWAELFVHSRAI